MVRVGFIGVGMMGMGQVNAFAQVKNAQIVAASDTSPVSLGKFAEKHPKAKTYSHHSELLKDNNVDAVVVVTPTYFHKDIAIEAMKSGRPVLTEKPMARTVADCHKMNEASAKTKKLLMVAHCRRFDTDWGAWAKIFKSGALGGPVLWRDVAGGAFSLYNPSGWFLDEKLGGGPLIDGAVHNYDFANLLFGKAESVVASSIKLSKHTAVDTACAVVRYESGNQLLMSWSWAIGSGQSLRDVLGPKAAMSFGAGELATPELDTTNYGYYLVADASRQKKKLIKFPRKDMYVVQAKHFIDCVEGKAKCISPGTEAIKAVAVAEAILKAGPLGREVKVKY
ncbi:MAG: Gfo/Idh/MocA family oxidoreductase [Planctomycetota bacterium]|nr:Gfo/Idh/MocA family oxidoreductase [Planctomycetota bacterium]